jgi:hypothetical protein
MQQIVQQSKSSAFRIPLPEPDRGGRNPRLETVQAFVSRPP